MKLTRIEGPPTTCKCVGCEQEGVGGTESFNSASTGEARTPEDWYTHGTDVYCGVCAAKLTDEDPTRSRSQFYTDTKGTNIDPDI